MNLFVYTLLAIVIVIGLLVLALDIFIRVCYYLNIYSDIRRMRQAGRCLSRIEFEQRVASSTGTVIFEYPTIGWPILRVWWTPDDVLACAHSAGISEPPPELNFDPCPFDVWCHDTYTDLQRGRAYLVPLYLIGSAFDRFERSLKGRFPDFSATTVLSGHVETFRKLTKRVGKA